MKFIAMRLGAIFCVAAIAGNSGGQTVNRPRQVDAIPAGEVTIVAGERLFNALLDGVFAFAEPPSYPLARQSNDQNNGRGARDSGASCESVVALMRESGGVRSAVRLAPEGILAPVAFRGSYDTGSLLGCFKFEGSALTEIDLSFDVARQALLGRLRVRQVNVQGLSTLLGGGLTSLVQRAVDEQLNPIEILKTEQLSTLLPLAKGRTDNALRLRATEVQPELKNGELRLRIFYEITRAGL